MNKETYRYRKGKERLEGGKIIRLHDINPFEFRGYFEGQEGINYIFQYKDVKRVGNKMYKIILGKDWIPAYYCKIHHCYDCQICKIEGFETPELKDERIILTTKMTIEWYQKRIRELERVA